MAEEETMVEEQPVTSVEELSSWSFIDRIPSTEEMLDLLKSLPAVHGIKASEYAEFVLPLTQDQNFGKGNEKDYRPVTKLYMTVAGRVKMLNDAAELHRWEVEESWEIVYTDPAPVIRIGIKILGRKNAVPGAEVEPGAGAIYGNRFGVAKLAGGETAWQKAETAARGRAIAAFGFGVLPGSGIASLEEMQDALFGERAPAEKKREKRAKTEIISDVKEKIERLRQLRGQDEKELDQSLQEYIKDRLGQAVQLTEQGLDLSKMREGNLLLLEGQLIQKIKAEEIKQSEI